MVKQNSKKLVRKVISKSTSEQVRNTLENVVSYGTGRPAYIDGYRVGGKTGTAQKVQDGVYMVGNYITSFIGFMPANDPEVVIYIAIDNAKGVTQYGGTIAAPIAKNILTDIIEILNIKKPTGGKEKTYNYLDRVYKEVPSVVGLESSEAAKILKDFKVEFTGSGKKVTYQSPSAKTRIYEGETVRLLLSD